MAERKIVAISKDRYRASAEERRRYGGAIVTEFYVFYADEERMPGKSKVITGYGKAAADRKRDAIEKFKAMQQSGNPRKQRRNPKGNEPFDRVPSAKNLARDLRIDDATAKKLNKVLKGDEDTIDEVLGPSNTLSYQSGRMSTRQLTMQAADKIYDTHGVEVARVGGMFGDPSPQDFSYLNTGDSYAPTLLFRGRRVWISSWGDEVEALERRGVRFENPKSNVDRKGRMRNPESARKHVTSPAQILAMRLLDG